MKKEKKGKKIIFKCGKKWEEKPVKKNKEAAEKSAVSTKEVENNG